MTYKEWDPADGRLSATVWSPSPAQMGEPSFCLDYTGSCFHDIRAAKVLTGLSFKLPINLPSLFPAE